MVLVKGRITPAHAGKTNSEITDELFEPDHPRACGENLLEYDLTDEELESPPRMRGKLPILCCLHNGGRITPAHAGKTDCDAADRSCRADHPRACGENRPYYFGFTATSGSPPRMRGKLYRRA